MESEKHPLQPFLPLSAKILMLGSFPPQRVRWSMDFFYPNFQNDMWRIVGYLFFEDKNHFVVPGAKHFDRSRIEAFCRDRGIAMYDTAEEVVRLKNNASDDALHIVRQTDIAMLLAAIPSCGAIVTTGQKATETLAVRVGCEIPPVGGSVGFVYEGRNMRLYRMPSSSRAYPKPVEWKAEYYKMMFSECGVM